MLSLNWISSKNYKIKRYELIKGGNLLYSYNLSSMNNRSREKTFRLAVEKAPRSCRVVNRNLRFDRKT